MVGKACFFLSVLVSVWFGGTHFDLRFPGPTIPGRLLPVPPCTDGTDRELGDPVHHGLELPLHDRHVVDVDRVAQRDVDDPDLGRAVPASGSRSARDFARGDVSGSLARTGTGTVRMDRDLAPVRSGEGRVSIERTRPCLYHSSPPGG